MKRLALLILLVAPLWTFSQRTGFGAGLILGEPTGISVKGWIGSDRAVDGALAWSAGHGSSFRIHADYLFHKYGAIKVSKGQLPLYYGPGLRLRFWNDGYHWYRGDWHAENGAVDLAVRFPVGLCYQFDGAPVDVFAEIVPALGLIPATYFDLDFAIGGRYWF